MPAPKIEHQPSEQDRELRAFEELCCVLGPLTEAGRLRVFKAAWALLGPEWPPPSPPAGQRRA